MAWGNRKRGGRGKKLHHVTPLMSTHALIIRHEHDHSLAHGQGPAGTRRFHMGCVSAEWAVGGFVDRVLRAICIGPCRGLRRLASKQPDSSPASPASGACLRWRMLRTAQAFAARDACESSIIILMRLSCSNMAQCSIVVYSFVLT